VCYYCLCICHCGIWLGIIAFPLYLQEGALLLFTLVSHYCNFWRYSPVLSGYPASVTVFRLLVSGAVVCNCRSLFTGMFQSIRSVGMFQVGSTSVVLVQLGDDELASGD
jgi:hypothetical protein